MIKKLFLSQAEKVKIGFWSLSQDRFSRLFFYLLILFLPTQFGKHFWPDFSFVFGLRLDYLSPTIYLTDIFILLIFLFSFREFKKQLLKINKKYITLYFIFLISLSFGLINSLNQAAGIYGIIKILEFSYLAFYLSYSFKSFSKEIIFACLLVSIVFESSLSILQYLNNSSLGGIFYLFGERAYNAQTPGIANAAINGQLFLRPYATFSHPNVLAGFLIIGILYLLFLNTWVKKNRTVLVAILIAGASLIISLSRGAIILSLAYAFLFFTFLIFEKFKNGKSKTGFILLVLFLIIFVSSLFMFRDSEVLQRFLSLNLTDESVVNRKELMNQSINMLTGNPIFGVGINNFYNNIKAAGNTTTLLIQPVHNIFLLVFSETGIVGFLFFLYLLCKSLTAILKKAKTEKIYLMLILITILFLSLLDHYLLTIQQGQLLLALFLGTAFSYKKT